MTELGAGGAGSCRRGAVGSLSGCCRCCRAGPKLLEFAQSAGLTLVVMLLPRWRRRLISGAEEWKFENASPCQQIRERDALRELDPETRCTPSSQGPFGGWGRPPIGGCTLCHCWKLSFLHVSGASTSTRGTSNRDFSHDYPFSRQLDRYTYAGYRQGRVDLVHASNFPVVVSYVILIALQSSHA